MPITGQDTIDLAATGLARVVDAPAARLTGFLADLDRTARGSARSLATPAEFAAARELFWSVMADLRDLESRPGLPIRSARARFLDLVNPWMLRSQCWNRAFTRPHGYPGDYRMLELMYDLEGDPGTDPTQPAVVSVLDDLFASVPSTQGAWFRRGWFADLVQRRTEATQPLRVLDLACGGSRYLRDVLTDPARTGVVEPTFIDQDPCAIAYVRSWLPDSAAGSLHATLVRKLAADILPDRHFDVVIATTLFDHLPDAEARALLTLMHRVAAPGATIAVCNVAPDDRTRVVHEWLGDWSLLHRSENDVAALFPAGTAPSTFRSPDGSLVFGVSG